MAEVRDLHPKGLLYFLEAFLTDVRREYIEARREATSHPNNTEMQKRYKTIKELIASDYFSKLTSLDGEDILEKLEKDKFEKGDRKG